MPFLCTEDGAVEVEIVDKRPPDCLVSVHGNALWVACGLIKDSADSCKTRQRMDLVKDDPIAVRFKDSTQTERILPAVVLKAHANGRLKVRLDGFNRAQTINRDSIIPLK